MHALQWQDFRFATRRLRKDAGTTIASIAALAFAIGAAVATWSLLSAVLLKPLSVAEPDRLFQVDMMPLPPGFAGVATGHSYPAFESIRDSGTFDGIAASAITFGPVLVTEPGGVPQGREVHFVAHNFFATLGVRAAVGRTFAQDEDQRGEPPVAVLSDHYWRSVFNADPSVLGRTVTIANASATIIGVLPRGFRGLYLSEAPDVYLPLHVGADTNISFFRLADPFALGFSWIRLVGRLRDGETPDAAIAHLNTLDCLCGRDLTQGEVGGVRLTNVSVAAVPEFARTGMTQFTTLLAATVGLLLLVGCLTVGMLLLVRTEDRREELALRLALGATRRRLAASIAVEAAILVALGAAFAVPIALWLFHGVRVFQLPGRIDIERLDLTLSPGGWLAATGTTLAATCAIALLASLVGIVVAARSPVQTRAFATPRVTRRAPRTALVAGQVAITLVLTTGAGLFARSVIEALSLNPAIETDRIVTGIINLSPHGYTPERAATFIDELRERLRLNSVIAAVSTVRSMGSVGGGVRLAAHPELPEAPSGLTYIAVEDNYFSTLGLPIVRGRGITRSDAAGAPLVAVVSESLGRFIADGGDPLGHRFVNWPAWQQPPVYLEIVGVVPDLITNVNATEPLVVYASIAQAPPSLGAGVVFRAAGDPGAAMREMLVTVKALDSRVTPERMLTLDQQLGQQMNPQRFGVYVLGALGGMALLLTVLGTYVIATSMVVRRRRELGIRSALGARSSQLRALVLRDTARLVGIGLVAGLVLAMFGARLIRSLLYQVEPLDPLVLVTVAAGIFGLALLVSLRPALEATRVDLTRSLREE
jgi:putative ABC transport system permease protein